MPQSLTYSFVNDNLLLEWLAIILQSYIYKHLFVTYFFCLLGLSSQLLTIVFALFGWAIKVHFSFASCDKYISFFCYVNNRVVSMILQFLWTILFHFITVFVEYVAGFLRRFHYFFGQKLGAPVSKGPLPLICSIGCCRRCLSLQASRSRSVLQAAGACAFQVGLSAHCGSLSLFLGN